MNELNKEKTEQISKSYKKKATCLNCNSENMNNKGKQLRFGETHVRYKCMDCGTTSYENDMHILKLSPSNKNGWDKAKIATDEAKLGNIPEIGLKENLQGLEVTGITYLKKDDNNILHWIKTKAKPDSESMLADFADRLVDRVPVAAVMPAPNKTDCSLLTQYTITDLHVGMYSWAQETGADWDLRICYESISKAIDIAIDRSPNSEIGLLLQLGDLAHYDGHSAVTPTSGNLVDADGRFAKMYDVCVDVHIDTIDKLLLKHYLVKVIVAEGNHDLSVSDTLRALVRRYYSKNPRVEIIGGPTPFYAYKHGKTMLGCHHGHLKKRDALPAHFSQYFSEIWGNTTHRYLHSGHLHSHHEEEKGGAITIQHSTLAAPDAYAAHRFDKTMRSINTITYSDKYGMISKNIIPIELVLDTFSEEL